MKGSLAEKTNAHTHTHTHTYTPIMFLFHAKKIILYVIYIYWNYVLGSAGSIMEYRVCFMIEMSQWSFGTQKCLNGAKIASLDGHLEGGHTCRYIWWIKVAEIDTSEEYWLMKSKIIYVTLCTDTIIFTPKRSRNLGSVLHMKDKTVSLNPFMLLDVQIQLYISPLEKKKSSWNLCSVHTNNTEVILK